MLDPFWETNIHRADELAAENSASRELLIFYGKLLQAQKGIYEKLRIHKDRRPSGELEEDLPVLHTLLPDLLKTIEAIGSPQLTLEAQALRQASAEQLDQLLLDEWQAPSGRHFFAKAFLQPYGRLLAERNLRPGKQNFKSAENRCPFCAGKPQVSCLWTRAGVDDGGGRSLICSTCLSAWPFRRVVCASCGEERPAKLGYFQSSQYDYVRIEACDSCGGYLKGVDLTRFGFAAPLVDEVAAAPLDVWAQEQGYQKIELNLVGL